MLGGNTAIRQSHQQKVPYPNLSPNMRLPPVLEAVVMQTPLHVKPLPPPHGSMHTLSKFPKRRNPKSFGRTGCGSNCTGRIYVKP